MLNELKQIQIQLKLYCLVTIELISSPTVHKQLVKMLMCSPSFILLALHYAWSQQLESQQSFQPNNLT